MIAADPEYQRSVVWDRTRQHKLIDSIMRGYPLLVMYLHHIKKGVGKFAGDDFEIIDGKQRITAICDYVEGLMDWHDVEVHHLLEHSQGGPTSLHNGAAVHKACHPEGATATEAFVAKFAAWEAARAA